MSDGIRERGLVVGAFVVVVMVVLLYCVLWVRAQSHGLFCLMGIDWFSKPITSARIS